MTSTTHSDEQIQEAATQQLEQLLHRWTEAQERSDVEALGSLLTDDFKLVGPLGYVVPRQLWLEQFSSGALQISALKWDEVDVRTHGYAQVAIAIGLLTQSAKYSGHPADGRFRVTVVALRHGPRWLIVGVHYSAIASPVPAPGSGRP